MVRSEAAAEDSLADILACNRLGMAIAAINKMIAITISNSTSENPRKLFLCIRFPNLLRRADLDSLLVMQADGHPKPTSVFQIALESY